MPIVTEYQRQDRVSWQGGPEPHALAPRRRAGAEQHHSVRVRGHQSAYGCLAGCSQVVQLRRGRAGHLGHEQGRMGADGSGDQWHLFTVAGITGASPRRSGQSGPRTPYGHGRR